MQEAAVLREYLNCHNLLQLEGFGRLEVVELPASLDFSNQQLVPGMRRLLYSTTVAEADHFTDWLQQHHHLSREAAAQWCSRFVEKFRDALRQEGVVALPLFGTFRQEEGTVVFVQQEPPLQLLPSVAAHRVIRKDAQHSLRVGDAERSNTEIQEWLQLQQQRKRSRWWAGALLVFLIALSSIFMYARLHYMQWKHQGSYRPVPLQETPRQYQE